MDKKKDDSSHPCERDKMLDIIKRNREFLNELSQTTSDYKKESSDDLNEALAQGSYDLELVEEWINNLEENALGT
jgi:hypothetical protein